MLVPILNAQATEERAEDARMSAFVGAIAVGNLVKLTLGPRGMDKLLTLASTHGLMVTNDGATILKSIPLDNPAAKVLVNLAKVQDDEVGDGTTLVTVLAAELLAEAERLVDQHIHPQTIIAGYRVALEAALAALEKIAIDKLLDKAAFREELLLIARTTLSSKILAQSRNQFAELAVDAVLRLQGLTLLERIQLLKIPGGTLTELFLDDGFILDKKFGVNQPKKVVKPKILVANTAMDTDKVKVFGAKFKVDLTLKLAELERAERDKMKAKVAQIVAYGADIFVNRQLIYDYPEHLFTDAKMNLIEHADFEGIERLLLVLGADVVSTFDKPGLVTLGTCDLVEEVVVGDSTMLRFSGFGEGKGQACTVVLRGATQLVLDEAERSLHDALSVLLQTTRETRTTLGGGCAEMNMAKAVDTAAQNADGKEALAVEAYARALRRLPSILAENAGFDASELVAKLRAAIYNGMVTSGLDLQKGAIGDMRDLGVVESYKLKRAVVSSASEAAEVLLRVDNILRAKPRTADRNRM